MSEKGKTVLSAVHGEEPGFQVVADKAPVCVFILQKRRVVYANLCCCQTSGFSREELSRMDPAEAVASEQRARLDNALRDLMEGSRESHRMEMCVHRKDGTQFWVDASMSAVRWNGSPAVLVVAPNVTARKQAEDHASMLLRQLAHAEEQERKRLAEGLHDSVGQTLTSAMLKLALLAEMVESDEARNTLREVRTLLRETSVSLRALIFELTPPILYERGLVPAIEWLGGQLQRRYGVPVTVELGPGVSEPAEDTREILFHSVRELLFNVGKHAKANTAQVTLKTGDDGFCVEIRDDGVGFDPDRVNCAQKDVFHWGLFSVRDRMQHLGGRMEIESAPGKSTVVRLHVPAGG